MAAARRRGRRAAVQAAPLKTSAAQLGRRGVHRARVWTAPRLERTGQAIEHQMAPKVAAMLSATARRIEPARPKRRRWPLVAAGLVAAAGLSATAAFLMSRREPQDATMSQPMEPAFRPATGSPVGSAATSPSTGQAPEAETATSDLNGRVRTP